MSGHILAVDTTSEHGSLALTQGSALVEQIEMHAPDGFSPVLFGDIRSLLDRHGLSLKDVDAFAAAAGPGSFTGVRVGLTAVMGLAEATGKPVFGVSNLQAMAWFGATPLRAVVLDARRKDVFGAVYDANLAVVQPESVGPLEAWLAGLPENEGLEILVGNLALMEDARARLAPQALAEGVARIAWDRLRGGERGLPEGIDANYVRRSDAELAWRDSQ